MEVNTYGRIIVLQKTAFGKLSEKRRFAHSTVTDEDQPKLILEVNVRHYTNSYTQELKSTGNWTHSARQTKHFTFRIVRSSLFENTSLHSCRIVSSSDVSSGSTHAHSCTDSSDRSIDHETSTSASFNKFKTSLTPFFSILSSHARNYGRVADPRALSADHISRIFFFLSSKDSCTDPPDLKPLRSSWSSLYEYFPCKMRILFITNTRGNSEFPWLKVSRQGRSSDPSDESPLAWNFESQKLGIPPVCW